MLILSLSFVLLVLSPVLCHIEYLFSIFNKLYYYYYYYLNNPFCIWKLIKNIINKVIVNNNNYLFNENNPNYAIANQLNKMLCNK